MLLGELLLLGARLLPNVHARHLQAMPALLALACDPASTLEQRSRAKLAACHLEALVTAQAKVETQRNRKAMLAMLITSRHLDEANDTFQLKPLDLSRVLDNDLDDTYISYLIRQSKVLDNRDPANWSWASIVELTRSSHAFAMRKGGDNANFGKLTKRLLSYYVPRDGGSFHTTRLTALTAPEVEAAKQLIQHLVETNGKI
jgi:hypothetical protein